MQLQAGRLPFRVALIYIIAAGAWILLSDQLLALIISDPAQRVEFSVLKGWGFVLLTGGCLHLLLRHWLKSWEQEMARRKASEESLRQSQERCQLTERAVNDGFWDWNILTDEEYFSPRWKEIIGYQDHEVANTKAAFFELLHPEDVAVVREVTRAHLAERKPYAVEFRLRHKDGSHRWVYSRGQAVRDTADRPVRMVGAITDITGRKLAEAKLAEANSLLNATLESTADGILVADGQGKAVSFNQKFLHLWQIPAGLAESRDDQRLLDYALAQLAEPAQFMAKVEELYHTPEATSWDELKFRDGRVFERYSQPRHLGGRSVGRVWSFRDVSKRKRAEAAQQESEKKFFRMFHSSPVAMSVTTVKEGRYVDVNAEWLHLYHADRADVIGRTSRELNVWAQPAQRDAIIARLKAHGLVRNVEVEFRSHTGQLRRLLWSVEEAVIGDENCLLGAALDITERQQVMDQLQETTRQLLEAQQIASLGSYDFDVKTGTWTCAAVMDEVFGIGDASFKKDVAGWLQIIHPDERAEMQRYLLAEVLTGRTAFDRTYRIVRINDRQERWVHGLGKVTFDDHGQAVRMLGVIQDITERKRVTEALRENEHFLRESQKAAQIGSYVTDLKTRTWKGSPEIHELFGIDDTYPHTLEAWAALIHPDSRAEVGAHQLQAEAEKKRFDHEYRILRAADGEERWMHGLGQLELDAQGQPGQMIGTVQDITKRKRAEEGLRQTEAKQSKMMANIGDVIVIIDADGINRYQSPNVEKWFGWRPAELVGVSALENIHPEDRAGTQKFLGALQREPNAPGTVECRYRCRDGSYKWIEFTGVNLLHDPDIRGLLGNYQNITERKLAESQIRRLTVFPELNPNPVLEFAADGTLTYQNAAALALPRSLGLSGMTSLLPPGVDNLVRDCLARRQPQLRLETVHGQRTFSASFFPISETGSVHCYMGDITERKQAEAQMHLQLSALSATANAIVITDRQGKIEWVNPSFTKLTGYSAAEAIGATPRVLKSEQHPRAFYATMWATILTGNVWHGEIVNKRKDGQFYHEAMTITPVRGADGQIAHFVAVKQDVTERRQLENRLQQGQKMEAIGTLAGGIAHDFNNILSAIFGNGYLLLQDTEGNPEAQENVAEVLKAATRAKELVQQILTFSRQRENSREPIRLDTVVKEATKFLRASLPAEIRIDLQLAADAPTVLADSTQIYQVTLNLATNALHAMAGRPGRLTVALAAFRPDAPFLQAHPEMRSIPYTRLTVADTGTGMDAPTLARIFEPFFTTKPVGKGTGLGLAVVHGIVQAHEGVITVESQPGQGTTFHIYFPAQHKPVTGTDPVTAKASTGQGQHILLLDDEPALTAIYKRLLERQNYRVTVRNRASEAVAVFRAKPAAFDLLITDLTMPEMNGLEVTREFHALRPELPVILVSGHAPDLTREALAAAGIAELLEKPVSLTALAEIANRLLVKPVINGTQPG